MRNRYLKSLILLALAGSTAAALAQEAPGRVGRVALTQGTVSVSVDGGEYTPAQVNWPLTSHDMITTARGARTELQVGGVFIRLDGDSSLQVLQLDDDTLQLRLHYGSASIRVVDADSLAGFELSTPEGRVTLSEPGEVRVDAERIADTSSVTVISGVAEVEGSGASLTLRPGKRAELRDDDVQTLAASRDGFDEWVAARDRVADAPAAVRYVSPDMTGYADLDRYGNWQTDPEYGTIWYPTYVSSSWVPYSDGSWVWVAPWGWTWVDNAPWGYAPFHYGRWVFNHNHWGWVPGHREHHPVWSPALVGWVGGGEWRHRFNDRHEAIPARGWYPLTPHDRFEPGYHVREDHLRRLNGDVHDDPRRHHEEHRGVTVVPQAQFGEHGRVPVANVPHATMPPQLAQGAPVAAPPAPPPGVRFQDHRGDERFQDRRGDERFGPRGGQMQERFDHRRDQPGQASAVPVLTAPSVPPAQRMPDQRPGREWRGEQRQPAQVPAAPPVPRPQEQSAQWHGEARPAQVLSAPPVAQPAQASAMPAPVAPPQWREQRERFEEARHDRFRDEGRPEHFERRPPPPAPAPVLAAPPVSQFPVPQPVIQHYQPMPPPAPVAPQVHPMQAPPPVMQAPPPVMPPARPVMPAAAQPASAAAPPPNREEHHGGRRDDRRMQDK